MSRILTTATAALAMGSGLVCVGLFVVDQLEVARLQIALAAAKLALAALLGGATR
jgi:hypothetical protein